MTNNQLLLNRLAELMLEKQQKNNILLLKNIIKSHMIYS